MTWALYYAGFYVMQVVVALFTMGSFRWEALIMATASFPIYLRALWNALAGGTPRGTRPDGPARGGRLAVRVHRAATPRPPVPGPDHRGWAVEGLVTQEVALSLVWNALNTLVFAIFVSAAWRERRDRRARATGPVDTTQSGGPRPRQIRQPPNPLEVPHDMANSDQVALGVAAVLALVGVLSLRLDAEVRTVHAVQGELSAQEYEVGTDYSGVLVDQYVRPGDVVGPGDPLFALKSNRLRPIWRTT